MMPGRQIEPSAAQATRQELLQILAIISEYTDGDMLISQAMNEVLPFFKESPLRVEIAMAGAESGAD